MGDMGQNETGKNLKQFPWVIPVNCEGCGDCVGKCPRHGLKMTETNVEGVFVPWMDDVSQCVGCGLCAQACVMSGIMMTTYVDQAIERFVSTKPVISTDQ